MFLRQCAFRNLAFGILFLALLGGCSSPEEKEPKQAQESKPEAEAAMASYPEDPLVRKTEISMKSVAAALEAYHNDNHSYPLDKVSLVWSPAAKAKASQGNRYARAEIRPLTVLTTPVAYLASPVPGENPLKDPCQPTTGTIEGRVFRIPDEYFYASQGWIGLLLSTHPEYKPLGGWVLVSKGPDGVWNLGEYSVFGPEVLSQAKPSVGAEELFATGPCLYDPSNGTMSSGDIVLVGGDPKEISKPAEGKK